VKKTRHHGGVTFRAKERCMKTRIIKESKREHGFHILRCEELVHISGEEILMNEGVNRLIQLVLLLLF
jgi:hypothetical protein